MINDNNEFNELCSKLAEGQASAQEINRVFDLLDKDVDSFSEHVASKLNNQE